MTTVRWIRSAEELERCASTLRSVASRAERPLPAADPDFLRSYAAHFEYSPQALVPEIIVVEQRGVAIGFLATRSSRRRVGPGRRVRERTLLVTHDHDRVNLVAGAADEATVARVVVDELLLHGNTSALDLAGLTVGSPLHHALHARASRSRLWTSYDIDLPSFCSVPVRWESVHTYFGALSKTMRSNVSRQTRRLFAAGDVEMVRACGVEQTAPLLAAYLDLEQRSWKHAAHAGILRSPKRIAFFADIVSGRAAYEPSMVGVVLNGVLIAGLLLGGFGSGMWALEMAYDDQHRDLGAGQVLLLLAMSEAIAGGADTLGYLQHYAYFKKRWLAEQVEVVSTRVVRRNSPVHVRHLVAELDRLRRGPGRVEPPIDGPGPRPVDPAPNRLDDPSSGRGVSSPEPYRRAPLPDAADASRRLLALGTRSGVRIGATRAAEFLPFPVR